MLPEALSFEERLANLISNMRILNKMLSDVAIRILGAKKQFLPSFEDLKDQECRELAERLKGKSVKETLTNILEWQERNVRYWNERSYVDIVPSRALILIYFVIFFIVSIPFFAVFYFLLKTIIGFYLATPVFIVTSGIFIYIILSASTSVKLLYILLFSYPFYQYLRSFLLNIQETNILMFIFDITVCNWIIFGFSMFLLIYLSLSYKRYARAERTLMAKIKRLWSLVTYTFSLSLPVSMIIEYRLAVCRDYAKLTATLLYDLFPDSDILFFTFSGHVATGIELNGKIYMLDQRLPVLNLRGWLREWQKTDVNSYKLVIKQGDIDIQKINMPLSRSQASYFFEDIEKNVLKDLNIRPCLGNSVYKIEIILKNYALYYEDDEIVKYSMIRSIKNIIIREFCESIDKITDIKIRKLENKKDFVVEVYYY